MSDPLNDRYQLARQLAVAAGRLTLKYFRTAHGVQRKDDGSPVTIADREAEQLVRQQVQEAFAQDGFLGEEFGEQQGASGFRWIVDPIDGTKSFISGVPLYGTMVAVEFEGRCRAGAIYFPPLDQLIHAQEGQGAWYGPADAPAQRAEVSRTLRLKEGLFVVSEVSTFGQRGARQAYDRLEASSWITRSWGDCYGYFLVATGKAVAMVDPIMSVWDAAALQPILKEAGGTFTDWQGCETVHAGEGIGTNGHTLDEVLAITAPFARPHA